ncbi:LppP/LprE family lipoprotein [Dietzia psychralcaliphila]|uniref:LppP/LprE lipoprotein n=1 Tax=Dietzia psychralcaliphila TaxID=139021 RepID=A0AAD0JTG1_9ACTN|nr:LppP/LprE family lipoprotein [Dietzia psychralcaliphila]AWH97565.1 hypothetical protein A6048_16595 [Dietzia psychralcaliphila]PTM89494.1 hypothetical protein C8N39_102337 [Dietzia psychralcaliphila]
MSGTVRTLTATTLTAGVLVAVSPVASAVNTDSLMSPPAGCAVDVQRIAAQTPGPFPGVGWTVGQSGNLCGELGYLFLETAGGTGSSPTRMVLFHRGVEVATQPGATPRVLLGQHSNFHVELRIQQEPAAGQPNAAAGYASTIYVWNPFAGAGDATPIGPLPPGITL